MIIVTRDAWTRFSALGAGNRATGTEHATGRRIDG